MLQSTRMKCPRLFSKHPVPYKRRQNIGKPMWRKSRNLCAIFSHTVLQVTDCTSVPDSCQAIRSARWTRISHRAWNLKQCTEQHDFFLHTFEDEVNLIYLYETFILSLHVTSRTQPNIRKVCSIQFTDTTWHLTTVPSTDFINVAQFITRSSTHNKRHVRWTILHAQDTIWVEGKNKDGISMLAKNANSQRQFVNGRDSFQSWRYTDSSAPFVRAFLLALNVEYVTPVA